MAKLDILAGTTSKTIDVFLPDSASTTGAGKTGLVYNTSGLTCYYLREGAASTVAMTLVTMTVGTWTSLGFKEIDATNMPGMYQIGVPNAAIAAGAKSVKLYIIGTGVAPIIAEIQLTAVDNQDAVRFGLSALPNGPMMFKKNQTFNNFSGIVMRSSTDHITPAPALSVTASRSIDGAAFSGGTLGAVTAVGSGVYKMDIPAADLNGNNIVFLFTATGGDPLFVYAQTQP